MKTVNVNGIGITAKNISIRQSGYHAELIADGTCIRVNFALQEQVMPFIEKFTTQYPFVAIEENTARVIIRMQTH